MKKRIQTISLIIFYIGLHGEVIIFFIYSVEFIKIIFLFNVIIRATSKLYKLVILDFSWRALEYII